MKIFCHICGTQAIDDRSLFCNICGTQLIPYIPEKNEDCPNCGPTIFNKETVFCSRCGTQSIDDRSLFCNICGTQLIPRIAKKNENCPNCGSKIFNKETVFCSRCGTPISANNSKITTTAQEAEQSKKDFVLLPRATVNLSHKPENKKSKSQKLLKRSSIFLPAILVSLACVFILVVISQTGVLDSLSSLGSITSSQDHKVVPANGTSTPTSTVTTRASTRPTAMMVTTGMSTPTPTLTAFTPTTTAAIMTTTGTSTPTPTLTTVAPTTQGAMKNIADTLGADGRFTTLVKALRAADLTETLSGDGPFTVFAPTNDAFNMLSPGSMDTFLSDPKGDLLQILLYHMANGKVTAADLKRLTSVETLQGGTLTISVSSGIITVDGATVITTDIQCSNGVIHVVDTVILPPA